MGKLNTFQDYNYTSSLQYLYTFFHLTDLHTSLFICPMKE